MKYDFEIIVLIGLFFTVVSVANIIFIIHFRQWTKQRDQRHEKMLKEVSKDIGDVKILFREEVAEVLWMAKKVINEK